MIETTYVRLERAAEMLGTDEDTLLIAASEGRLVLYGPMNDFALKLLGRAEADESGEVRWHDEPGEVWIRPKFIRFTAHGALDLLLRGESSEYAFVVDGDDDAPLDCDEYTPPESDEVPMPAIARNRPLLVRQADVAAICSELNRAIPMEVHAMKINYGKEHGGALIPIAQAAKDANCTVSELLQLAENGEVCLLMALRRFTATSSNTLGKRHPNFPRRSAAGEDAYVSPAYARELHRFGKTTVTHIDAENMPTVDGDDLWFWKLDEPQEVGVDQIFVCQGHISAIDKGPGATTEESTQTKPQSMKLWREQAILATLKTMGLDPMNLPSNDPGKPGVRSRVRETLKNGSATRWSRSAFDHAWDDMRKDGQLGEG